MRVEIHGIKQAIAAMQGLTPALRIRHMRIALNAACGVIKNRIVATAPKDTGLLVKSQRVKVKIPQASKNPAHHDKPAWGMIGAGRGLLATVTKRGKVGIKTTKAAFKDIQKGKAVKVKVATERGKMVAVRASRYAHFAEKGRKGKGGTHFMANAAQSAAAEANQKFAEKIGQGIRTEAARLASKP